MKCLFCAEDIQELAILCRFCGAEKRDGQWVLPAQRTVAPPRPKGNLTIKISAGLFALSGAYALLTVTSEVALFGGMRGGVVAIAYNLLYAALFFGLAFVLMTRKPRGFSFLMAVSFVYTLDKLLFLLDSRAQKAYLAASGVTSELSGLIDLSFLDQAILLTTLASILCWWGFVGYMYFRRDYFLRGVKSEHV